MNNHLEHPAVTTIIDNCFVLIKTRNNAKADKLPSSALLKDSRSNILHWWQSAYLDDDKLSEQFFIEAYAFITQSKLQMSGE